jgi:hypothetical protein
MPEPITKLRKKESPEADSLIALEGSTPRDDRAFADRSLTDRSLTDRGLADHGLRRRRLTNREIGRNRSAHEGES